ncbi:MAG: permease-like cell division protein FtsX [Chitinophagaceae bacterium]|nr:permease-like cell division protein FtsX [Chitinophagaceae bacterium]MCW5925514.1 permease-like cell division protein FtsX [Chitinophagaceae bacterium]
MEEISRSSMRRSKPSFFFSILGVASLLILIGVFGWLVINGSKLERYFRSNVQVQVFLTDLMSDSDTEQLLSDIKAKSYTVSAKFISKAEAKEIYLKDGNETWEGILDENPLKKSIEFNLRPEYVNKDSLNIIVADLEQVANVDDVKYPKDVVVNLNDTVKKISWVLLGIVIGLGILVLVLIDNTIKLAMFSNRFLIKTMQMVGATRWFISKPFDIKAVVNGLVSALIAIAVIIIIIMGVEKWLPEIKVLRDYTLLGFLFLGIIVIGIGITFISTHRSVTKYLKMKLDDLY